jgi:hypothetical protein
MGDAQKEIGMKNLMTCLVVSVMSGAAFATTWTVDDDGKADFNNIQAAVNAASDGDEIIVMPGTYTSTQDGHVVNMLGKAVTLRSSDPSDPDVVTATIIDGENTRRGLACFNTETSKTIISGFTITNGYGMGFDYNGSGGIDWYENNGGGMYNITSSSPTLTNCIFTGNSALYYGGGMYNITSSSPTLTGCTFENNTADSGSGMWNELNSSPTLTNCTFTGNTATLYGGGMYNITSSSPILTNCLFTNNTAVIHGGGMFNNNSSPTLTTCIFTGNTAQNGGGMRNSQSNPMLSDTTVCGNMTDQIYGDWADKGGNVVADVCPLDCPDINGDGSVGITDLLAVIDVWGCSDCNDVDVNLDGIVNRDDLIIVFNAWGACQ